MNPFHLAIPVKDLKASIEFYSEVLGCSRGRSSKSWADFNFFGHQLVCHVSPEKNNQVTNVVDGEDVPVPHFGIILDMQDFNKIASRLLKKEINFIIEPTLRFKGEPGEQKTMFFYDPSFNAIEIKAFNDSKEIFRVS